MGRPAKKIPNRPKDLKIARQIAALGATNQQLADFFDTGLTTLNKWLSGTSKFATAIKEGRSESCQTVIDSVFKRACGYEYVEEIEKPEHIKDKDDNYLYDKDGNPIIVMRLVSRRHKHQPADIPAAKFYLWNRTKTLPPEERWTDKQHLDHSSTDGSMSPKEALIKEGMNAKEAVAAYQQLVKDTQK